MNGIYGNPPRELAERPADSVQLSPLVPGSPSLDQAKLDSLVMLSPPGALERRHELALALRALKPGAAFTVMAPKDKGGSRLRGELEAFGCQVEESAKRHHRICSILRPDQLTGLDEAISATGRRLVEGLGLWSQPGVFSFDRIDPGSALLRSVLPPMAGDGADFGCGIGVLAHAILASQKVTSLALIDIDRRAIELARRNVSDPRAAFHWADVADGEPALEKLDFVVMNPPFHDAGTEDRRLGQQFIRRAGRVLRKGGVCWLVANRHLPYEGVLGENFNTFGVVKEASGYKVFEAVR